MMIRDIIFCKRCGYNASWKAQQLNGVCNQTPKHNNVAQQLRRMLRGEHPDHRVLFWPGGGPSTKGVKPVINIDGV